MKIGIIGLGVIGSALQYGFEKLGHDVKIHEIKLKTDIKIVLDTEIVYICVPTKSKEDGSCDTSIVEWTVSKLIELEYKGIIAIKSTVEPGTTQRLIEKHSNTNICFVPEFLRERCAITDFTENHDLLAVGYHDLGNDNIELFNSVVQCHGKYPKNITKLNPTEAELLKYYSNTLNAVKVIFANTFYEVANKLNADYSKIKNAFIKRGTEVDMYLDVNDSFRGYSGPCVLGTALCKININNIINVISLKELYENYNGNVMIESVNSDISEIEFKKIIKVIKSNYKGNLIKLFFSDKEFICTENHLIPVERDGEIILLKAKDIKTTDILYVND